jgi:hypothetical protein
MRMQDMTCNVTRRRNKCEHKPAIPLMNDIVH